MAGAWHIWLCLEIVKSKKRICLHYAINGKSGSIEHYLLWNIARKYTCRHCNWAFVVAKYCIFFWFIGNNAKPWFCLSPWTNISIHIEQSSLHCNYKTKINILSFAGGFLEIYYFFYRCTAVLHLLSVQNIT